MIEAGQKRVHSIQFCCSLRGISSGVRDRAEKGPTHSSTAADFGSGFESIRGRSRIPTEPAAAWPPPTRKRYLIIGNGASGTYARDDGKPTLRGRSPPH